MSATVERTKEGFLARYRALAGGLPGAHDARESAARALREHGLPTTHIESWRFTNLAPLAGMVFRDVAPAAEQVERLLASVPAAAAPSPLIVVANGRFMRPLSRLPAKLDVAPFAERPALVTAEAAAEAEAVVTLNTMLAEDGAVIRVPKGIDGGTLVLLHLGIGGEAGSDPAAFHPRHRLRLLEGARLTLVEVAAGEGVYLHNPVTDIEIGEGAALLHLRIQSESAAAFHLDRINARLERDARYHGVTLSLGARLARSEIHVELAGAGAAADLDAAQLLEGQQHADITTVVKHLSPNAVSRQTVKNVLTGRSHAVFQGRISVVREAQKTDAYQRNETLLLSPTAQVNSKPELEIFADDVKCSHGATVGALDANQLFYLQSRGVPLAEARGMLVRGFLTEMFAHVADDGGRALLEQASNGWWKSRVL